MPDLMQRHGDRCRAGGCDKPAHATDAHHIRWWRHGGRTDRNNLVHS